VYDVRLWLLESRGVVKPEVTVPSHSVPKLKLDVRSGPNIREAGVGMVGQVVIYKSFESSFRLARTERGWRETCLRFQGLAGRSPNGVWPSYG